jgi:hypothetical protein
MSWKRMFSPRVLERGCDYWSDGLVHLVSRTSSMVTAIVSGSEDYEVEIELGDKGAIAEMYCDCPHACDGNNCKHMAAVLYELEDGRDADGPDGEKDQDVASLQEIIEALSVEQLRAELSRAVSSDAVLTAQFIGRHAAKRPDDAKDDANDAWDGYISAMQLRIDQIIDNCSDSGFVDWRQGPRLVRALDNEVFRDLLDVVEYGEEPEVPFELSLYLLDELADINIDGSSGEHDDIGVSLVALWEGIYKLADIEQRNAMFSSMLAYYEGATEDQWYFSDLVWDFMQENFDTDILNQRKLALVDAQLESLEEQIQTMLKVAASVEQKRKPRGASTISSFTESRELAKLVLERIALMEKLRFERPDILAFRQRFRFLHQVRELEMEELEEEGNLERLVQLLIESRGLDTEYAGLVVTYSEKLIDCYEKLGQHDDARKEAYDFVVQYQPGSPDGFLRLKTFYTAQEWKKVREDLFSALRARKLNLNRLYREEGLFDRIMASITQEASHGIGYASGLLSEIARYEDVLRPAYEMELLDIYRQAVIVMARPTSGREGYREIVKKLRHMLDYTGGEACVRALLNEWRNTYGNRPAMQDELKGVFYKN